MSSLMNSQSMNIYLCLKSNKTWAQRSLDHSESTEHLSVSKLHLHAYLPHIYLNCVFMSYSWQHFIKISNIREFSSIEFNVSSHRTVLSLRYILWFVHVKFFYDATETISTLEFTFKSLIFKLLLPWNKSM